MKTKNKLYYKNLNNHKGFTLIELLTVIAVIGLLSTLAVVSLNNARQKSRDAKRVSDIKQIQTALELYYADKGSYPIGNSLILGAGSSCGSSAVCESINDNGITDLANVASPIYMGQIAGDPSNPTADCVYNSSAVCNYRYVRSGNSYNLFFYLEGATGDLAVGPHCATPLGIFGGSCS